MTWPFMKEQKAELLYEAKATLAEGPGWNEKRQDLLWVDIEKGEVHRFDPATGTDRTWQIGSRVGFAVDTTRGDVIAGTQKGLVRLNLSIGDVALLTDPEADLPNNRFNDGKCDPKGRLWAGSMSVEETEGAGSFYRIHPDLKAEKAFRSVTISNGIAWSPDSKTMYYIDTPTVRVDAFDYDPETGSIHNRRPVIRIPEGVGFPDGMTIDREGMLWIAMWAGWSVTRWNPSTGEMIGKIELPVEKVTACCFGGTRCDRLYITTASRDLTDEDRKLQPLAGSLFLAEPGVRGFPAAEFHESK